MKTMKTKFICYFFIFPLILQSCDKNLTLEKLDDTNISRIVRQYGLKEISGVNKIGDKATKEFNTFQELERYLKKREHLVDTLSLSPKAIKAIATSNNKKADVDYSSETPMSADYRYLSYYSNVFKEAQFPCIIFITLGNDADLKLQYDGANIGTWYFNKTYAKHVNDVLPTKYFVGDGIYTEVFSVGGIFQYEKSYSFNAELTKIYSYSTPKLYAIYKPLSPN